MGLLEESVALVTLTLWALVEVWGFRQALRERSFCWRSGLYAATGPALAALLLVAGGGVITGLVTGALGATGRLSVGWISDPGSRRPFGFFETLPGGVGLLGLGPLLAASVASLLAWRRRAVMALVAGSGVFVLAGLVLQYQPARDVTRLDGHARNFALLALLLALSMRLSSVRPSWRYTISSCLVALVVWPTVAASVHSLGLGLAHGPRFENSQPGQPFVSNLMRRHTLQRLSSTRVAGYIQQHTATEARILSPQPIGLTVTTGRPNAAGFLGHLHLHPTPGAEYVDAIRYLEPAAVRRLGYAYLHATDDWVAGLPDRPRRWLADPSLFEPLVQDGSNDLYRIRSEFLHLEVKPAPESFEALRRAIPPSAQVYFSPAIHPLDSVRAASVLSHAQIRGELHHADLYLLTEIPTSPLGSSVPDFVVVSARVTPSMLNPSVRQPIWWNSALAVYALTEAVKPISALPRPSFSVSVSEVRAVEGRIAFTATFTDRAPDQWRGQDWLVTTTDSSQWALPSALEQDGQRHAGAQWYAGQIIPGQGTTLHGYEFDPRAVSLLAGDEVSLTATQSSGSELGPGVWALAVRLRGDWWKVALIPVMKIVVAEDGEVHYEVYKGELNAPDTPMTFEDSERRTLRQHRPDRPCDTPLSGATASN